MTRDEVRSLMHDYFDGVLSLEMKESVESYLEEYEDLAKEFELLNKLLGKAQSLPIGIKTPDTITSKIADELLNESLQKLESEKQRKLKELTENIEREGAERKRLNLSKKSKTTKPTDHVVETSVQKKKSKIPFVLLIAVFLIVVGYLLYGYLQTNLPWNVKLQYGQYQIGAERNKNKINVDETLLTYESTEATLIIPGAGNVNVESFSSVKVIKGKDDNNIISLESGSVDVKCNINNPSLIVKTIPANIKAISGDFNASLNASGELTVRTSNGTVEISNEKEELTLVRDHICEVKPSGNIGVPYYINSDPTIIKLLHKICFGEKSISAFDSVLNLATPKNGISLLYLLKETKNPVERESIFNKLNEFYPVVPGITKEGIIKLNKNMFEKWRDDIEWQI